MEASSGELLEQEDERGIRCARDLLQARSRRCGCCTGARRSVIGELGGLVAQRRGRQLRVQQATIARHATAGRAAGTSTSSASARAIASSLPARPSGRPSRSGGARRMPTLRLDSAAAAGDRAPTRSSRAPRSARSARARPSSRRGATSSSRPCAHELASITTGARRPRSSATARRGLGGHVVLPAAVALRAPRRRAAVPGDVGRNPQRQPGAGRDLDERLGQRGRVARSAGALPKMRLMQAGR